jgi:hypothetical protein
LPIFKKTLQQVEKQMKKNKKLWLHLTTSTTNVASYIIVIL